MNDAIPATESGRKTPGPQRSAQILKGMRDFVPERMIPRQYVVGKLREVFERHGFEPIDTPALEYYETLAGKYGEDEKLIYHFADHGGREIGLRYDLTVPLARFIAVHRNELTFPFKRYHIGPVWRADRPQKGRYREFWQCDADIVGSRSMLADADIVSIVIEALQAVNMPNFIVHINHRKLLESIALYAGVHADRAGLVYRAIDKLAKIGPGGVVDELSKGGVDAGVATRIVDLVSTSGQPDVVLSAVADRLNGIELAREAIADLDNLFSYLAALGAPAEHYVFDLALARGLEYYTGPVFETTVDEPRIGSLGGAGRYDGLVGMFSGQDLPATGMSLGLERIIDVAEELGLLDIGASVSDVLVTIFDADHTHASLTLAAALRSGGVRCETFLEEGRDLGRQLRYAGRRGIPFATVLGPDESARGVVTLRDMQSGEQIEVVHNEIIGVVQERLRDRTQGVS
jgi:histidyl-tRNA synthetase